MFETTCRECKFKDMDNGSQTGCSVGVLTQLEKNGVDISKDGGFFKFPGVCMSRRLEQWEGSYTDLFIQNFIPSTFVIIHSEGSNLVDTLKSISKVVTPKPTNVIICHDTHNLKEIHTLASENLSGIKFQCVYMVDKLYKDIMYDEAFNRAKNGWVFFVDSGKIVPDDYLEAVNFSKNHLLLNFVAVFGEIDGYLAIIYKHLKGNKAVNIKEKIHCLNGNVITQDKVYENFGNLQ